MRTRLTLTLAVLIAVSAIGFSAAPAAGATRQVALGVAIRQDRSIDVVDKFTASLQAHRSGARAPGLWSIWSNWGQDSTKWFPGCPVARPADCDFSFVNALHARGTTPVIWWQPSSASAGSNTDSTYRYQAIADGAHDAYLRRWARQAKAWGKPVIIRLAHEMNGYWFPWGVPRFDNTPANFLAAWRRMWNLIKVQEGATNVKFLWSPYGLPCGSSCTGLTKIFPGDNYVDYVGFSRFNWGGSQWVGMKKMMEQSMSRLLSLSKKPIIVAEMASQVGPRNSTKNKGKWIQNGYPAVYNAWPRVVGIIYFNVDMSPHGQPNWTLDGRQGALAAYAQISADARFQGSLSGSTPPPPPPPPPPPGEIQPPTATLRDDAQMTSTMQAWLDVSWPAVEGASQYQLQQRINNNSWINVALPSPTATSVGRAIKPGRNVTFQVRALVGGTWSAWATGPTMPLAADQEVASPLVYNGTWTRASLSGAFGGFVNQSPTADHTVTYTFTGRSVAFVTAKGKGRGNVEVSLDGAPPETINLFQSTLNTRFVAWSADVDPSVSHTVTLRVTGTGSAPNTRVDVDAFVVLK